MTNHPLEFWQSAYKTMWREVSDLPHHNNPVWLYFEDMGNDDEGYGYTMVGRYDPSALWENGRWLDDRGKPCQPTMWANLETPQPPLLYDAPPSKGGKLIEEHALNRDTGKEQTAHG